ncbi:MAG: EFR1 family ferrodoxin [Bacillota bacterium]
MICYYSSTGNTELALRYIERNLSGIEFDFYNILDGGDLHFDNYQVVGFATFTDWWGIPYIYEAFLDSLALQHNKYAFILNTYAHLSGKTLKDLYDKVSERGFKVIAAHSLRTPASYPPAIAKGRTFAEAPSFKEFWAFNRFISQLNTLIAKITRGINVRETKLWIGIVNSLVRRYPRSKARDFMGKKFVEKKLCTKCGTCINSCPGKAITLTSKVVFDESKCYGCWSCFNHCPQKAIHTENIRGVGHYPGPSNQLRVKLKT